MNKDRTKRASGTSKMQQAAEYTIAMAAVALLIVGALLSGHSATPKFETHSIKVKAGDTLWSVARSHPIPGLGTAQTVEAIADLNGVTEGDIQAGSTLIVPTADTRQDSSGVLAMGASHSN